MAGRSKKTSTGDQLTDYRRKRDFTRTAEPAGSEPAASESGRLFVVQKHDARNLHYDLRLELDGVLKSWAVPRGPSLDPSDRQLAVLVEDHPMEYATFEGIIPKGEYGGGTVMLWDQGNWEPKGDPRDGLERGDLKFLLQGTKLRGEWVLARMTGEGNEDGRNWLLIKKRDQESRSVQAYNVLAEQPLSVRSGRSMDEIADDPEAVWADGGRQAVASRGAEAAAPRRSVVDGRVIPDASALQGARAAGLPDDLKPQLAGSAKQAPDGDDWLHEIKLDGYRLICRIEDGTVRLITRNGHDWTDRFPAVAKAAAGVPIDPGILDGEVVVLDAAGISDFQALQNAFRFGGPGPGKPQVTYYCFDIPFAQGQDLRQTPLIERKQLLERVLELSDGAAPVIRYCEHLTGRGPIVFQEAARAGLEGIISKRAKSTYQSRRSSGWLKVKSVRTAEFVVGGYTAPAGSRVGLGALCIGQCDADGGLVYCGRVGTGFSDAMLGDLRQQLEAIHAMESPFTNPTADPDYRTVQWVDPVMVVEVEYGSWTGDKLVRHATFRGVRPDKDPAEVLRDDANSTRPMNKGGRAAPLAVRVVKTPRSPKDAVVGGVRISNPRRTVYPEAGITKRQVAEYYHRVEKWVLPHMVRRPLSIVRCPLGLAGEAFYQKHVGEGFPEAIGGIPIAKESAEPYILIKDATGLLSLVQMGVLEIHSWGCRADDLTRPDQLVFDLDPGPGIEWEHVVESARFIRGYLDDLGLRSFVKTSGGKGMHLVVPLIRRCDWDQAKVFARSVAQSIVRKAPRNFVASMSKSLRQYRIYIDYLRNTRGATAVAPYSTRARPGGLVSTPLHWEELSPDLTPKEFTVSTVPTRLERLTEDPWADFRTLRQSITAKMRTKVGM